MPVDFLPGRALGTDWAPRPLRGWMRSVVRGHACGLDPAGLSPASQTPEIPGLLLPLQVVGQAGRQLRARGRGGSSGGALRRRGAAGGGRGGDVASQPRGLVCGRPGLTHRELSRKGPSCPQPQPRGSPCVVASRDGEGRGDGVTHRTGRPAELPGNGRLGLGVGAAGGHGRPTAWTRRSFRGPEPSVLKPGASWAQETAVSLVGAAQLGTICGSSSTRACGGETEAPRD